MMMDMDYIEQEDLDREAEQFPADYREEVDNGHDNNASAGDNA